MESINVKAACPKFMVNLKTCKIIGEFCLIKLANFVYLRFKSTSSAFCQVSHIFSVKTLSKLKFYSVSQLVL